MEWPGRDSGSAPPRGYAYVTFENERRVRALLSSSRYDGRDWYYRITSRKMRNKEARFPFFSNVILVRIGFVNFCSITGASDPVGSLGLELGEWRVCTARAVPDCIRRRTTWNDNCCWPRNYYERSVPRRHICW